MGYWECPFSKKWFFSKELTIDKKSYKTVAQSVQKNYATNEPLNIEFKVI